MKFYYEAKHKNPCEDDSLFLCVFVKELKKDDCIIIDLGMEFDIVTGFIIKRVDDLVALTSHRPIIEVIEVIDLTAYRKAKEEHVQSTILLNSLEDKMKTVKLIDSIRKIASHDPEMSELLANYEKLTRPNPRETSYADSVSD